MMTLLIAMGVLLFINALYFMTDYKNLFGLELPLNKDISFFHDEAMQPYNRFLLFFSIGCLLIAVAALLLECFSKVPDAFALTVMAGLLLVSMGVSAYLLHEAIALQEMYLGLDFSYLELEAGSEHIVTLNAFTFTDILLVANILVDGLAIAALWRSNRQYRRSESNERA